jgi:type IV pilus assembly protein PilE
MRKTYAGITLIELMVVIMVVSILAALAVPAYGNYVMRASRADGKAALLAVAGQLERCFTRFNAYDSDDCAVVLPMTSTEGKYEISATTLTATNFELEAEAVEGEGQERDTECGTFTLDSANARGASGAADAEEISRCWGR